MVKLKSNRKQRLTRLTFTPVAAAKSGENRVNTQRRKGDQDASTSDDDNCSFDSLGHKQVADQQDPS